MVNDFGPLSPQKIDDVFNALANAKRRSMLDSLSETPATVSKLAVEHKLSLPAIHKHIRVLEHAGLLNRHKVGRVNFVALNRVGLQIATGWLGNHQAQWGKGNQSLESYIARFVTKR